MEEIPAKAVQHFSGGILSHLLKCQENVKMEWEIAYYPMQE